MTAAPKSPTVTREDLPEVAPGHWDTPAGRDMAVQTLNDRHMLACRERTSDLALANKVFLSPGIGSLTAAKERIRWLSARLALLEHRLVASAPGADWTIERDADGEAMVCRGCGTTRTVEHIRYISPTALTCCPERKMVPVREALASPPAAVERGEVAREHHPIPLGQPPEPVSYPDEAWCERYAAWYEGRVALSRDGRKA